MTDEQIAEAFKSAGGERDFTPQFGDTIRGIWAGTINPHRDGFYLRTVRRSGRFNPGTFYELTDQQGDRWEYPAHHTVRVAKASELEQRIRESERERCAAKLHAMHLAQIGRQTEHNYFAMAIVAILAAGENGGGNG